MAARRQAASSGSSPSGLKIKLRAGAAAARASKGSQPEESGEDVGAEPGDDSGVNEGVLKRKRPSPPSSPTPNKKPAREEFPIPLAANGEPVEVVPGKSEAIPGDLHVVKQRVGQPHASVGAVLQAEQAVLVGADRDNEEAKKAIPNLENISHGQLVVNSVTADELGALVSGKRAGADPAGFGEQSQSVTTGVQTSLSSATPNSRIKVDTEEQHTVPSHAGWFSWTRIHTLERRGLPEFFNGKTAGKTPNLYMEYRNAIITRYRGDLKKMLTVADVQEQLSDLDEKTISRVLEFLDHWGLINYHTPAELRPVWKGPVPFLEADVAGMLRALPQKGSSLFVFDTPRAPVPKQGLVQPRSSDAVIAEMFALPEGPEVEYHCNTCVADCSKQRYHCQKQADFDLCPDCYNEGKFGPDTVSTDFMRMDVTEPANENGGVWTDQETLLLLEALELYGDNWNEIAEHVATKSKSQCILHFIRLPVEDSFLEEMETPGVSSTIPAPSCIPKTDNTLQGEKLREDKDEIHDSTSGHVLDAEAAAETSRDFLAPPPNLIAFADAPNPVMAQVAFLAAMVGPRVAAAAAQAALATLTQKDPGPRLAASISISIEGPAAGVHPPSSSQQPDRLVSADPAVQSLGNSTQPGHAEGGGTAVFGQGSATSVKANDNRQPLSVSDPGKAVVSKAEVNGKLNIAEEAISARRVRQAAASAIAAAAVKAKLLADQEEREMQRLVTIVIEQQLKKLELKLKTFNDLETMLAKECESVERARQKIHTEHARMVATRLGTSSSPNPPTVVAGQQTATTGQRAAGFTFGSGGQATPVHASGSTTSYQVPSSTSSAPSQGLQGLARPVTAGAVSTPQGQFVRQGMVGGTPPQIAGRSAVPQAVTPSPQVLGRPSIPNPGTTAQTLGRPLTAPPRMSRPTPGGTSSGVQ